MSSFLYKKGDIVETNPRKPVKSLAMNQDEIRLIYVIKQKTP
jgi:hypothetical protein